MITTIAAQAALAGTLQGTHRAHDVNYVVVTLNRAPLATDFMTIQLESKYHARRILLNRVQLLRLADVSDLRHGASANLQAAINVATGVLENVLCYPIVVEVGCLKNLANDSSLAVTVETTTSADVSVAAVFMHDGPDRVYSWLQSRNLSDSFPNAVELYLLETATAGGIVDPAGEDLSIVVHTPSHGSFICDADSAFGVSAALGNIEAHGPQHAICIYKAPDGILETVQINISGGDAGNYEVLAISRELDVRRVSRGQMYTTAKTLTRLRAMMPDKARALRRARITPHPAVVDAALKSMNEGTSRTVGSTPGVLD